MKNDCFRKVGGRGKLATKKLDFMYGGVSPIHEDRRIGAVNERAVCGKNNPVILGTRTICGWPMKTGYFFDFFVTEPLNVVTGDFDF